jgi:hypothetical protein
MTNLAHHRAAGLLVFIAEFLCVTGCARAPREPMARAEAVEVIVEPSQLSLQAGSAARLAAQVNDASGQPIGGAALRFVADDASLLRVGDTGLVESTGRAVMQTFVVVSSGVRSRRVPVSITAGPPERVEKLSGDGQQIVAGTAPQDLVARVSDAWANPVAGIEMVLRSESPMPPIVVTSDATGVVQIKLPAIRQAGSAVLVVNPRDRPQSAVRFRLHVTAAAPARVTAETKATPQANGVAVIARVNDAFDNPVAGATLRITASPAVTGELEKTSDAGGSAEFVLGLPARSIPRSVAVSVEPGSLKTNVELPPARRR